MKEIKITGHKNVIEIINFFELEDSNNCVCPFTSSRVSISDQQVMVYSNKKSNIHATVWKNSDDLKYSMIVLNVYGV